MRKFPEKTFYYIRDFVRVLLIVLVFSTILNFWYINQQRDYFQQYITHSTELRVLTQQVTKYATESAFTQKENVFPALKISLSSAAKELEILTNGELIAQNVVLPPSPEKIKREELSRFNDTWEIMKEKSGFILENKDVIINLEKMSKRLVTNINHVRSNYWDLVSILENSNNNENKNITLIARQISLSQDIVDDIENIITVDGSVVKSMTGLSGKISLLFSRAAEIKANINNGSSVNMKLSEIDDNLKLVRVDANAVSDIGGLTEKIYNAIVEISNLGPVISGLSKNLENAYVNYQKSNTFIDLSAYILGFSCFLVLIFSIYLLQKESGFHLKATEEKNKLMQTEVDKLLKELPDLATGNSKIELTAPNITGVSGMITESFSYALNTLRKLVHNIGRTAQNVSVSAVDAQKIIKELAAFSGNQAQEIVEVTASVSRMAVSIEEVSTNAAESAEVALDSVNIASEGGKVVRSTISGMERIQTQIQETSSYMKRLSDSSQEIGEIVSLIDGIADQTNILSLNASIQAAMAGEAGRGFAVVADEVQRLAEKVSYATKEIGSLVRSIQTDTGQVIVAMEQTKEQVQEGVKFAQDAGGTLEKIETVSRRLSDLIQNISSSASEQALVSGKISHIMNDVKDIAKQTATGTMSTVDLIGKLMQYVTDLRNSVFEL